MFQLIQFILMMVYLQVKYQVCHFISSSNFHPFSYLVNLSKNLLLLRFSQLCLCFRLKVVLIKLLLQKLMRFDYPLKVIELTLIQQAEFQKERLLGLLVFLIRQEDLGFMLVVEFINLFQKHHLHSTIISQQIQKFKLQIVLLFLHY